MKLPFDAHQPSWLDMESVLRMPVVEQVTSLSADNVKRTYPSLVVKLSPRREGMKLKDALAIANGTAPRG